jgi:hypothetical protein
MTTEVDGDRHPVGIAPESSNGRLVVVCDDGSVWAWHHEGRRWEEMAPVPGTRREVDVEARGDRAG